MEEFIKDIEAHAKTLNMDREYGIMYSSKAGHKLVEEILAHKGEIIVYGIFCFNATTCIIT